MPKSKIVAGIEVGSSKVTTLIAQVQADSANLDTSVNIVGVSSVEARGIKKGQIVDIEEAVDATVESVEGAERMAGYNLDRAFVSLGGAHISSQNSHGVVAVSDPDSEITTEDVDRVIEAVSAVSLPSSRELIHVMPREFVVDGEAGVKDPVGMSGIRLEVETHLITASNAAVKNLKRAINEVGVAVEGLVFTGLAASEAVITKTEKELGCAVVDIGGGTTSICAYIDGSLAHSSVIPIGAKNVTNDLAIGLRVTLESAEKIKLFLSEHDARNKNKKDEENPDQLDLTSLGVQENKKVSKKTLTEGIIKPRLNEIFTMVGLEIKKSGYGGQTPSGLVVTGGGARTIGVVDCAKRMLAMPVRIGAPQNLKGIIDEIQDTPFATVVGLAVYGGTIESSGSSLPFGVKMPNMSGVNMSGFPKKVIDVIKSFIP